MTGERSPVEWALLPVKRYAEFSGRSSRAEYWWFTLVYFLAGFLVDAVDLAVGSEFGVLGLLYTLGFFLPMMSVSVRRLHDTNRSGWWLLVPVVPAAVFGFLATVAKLDGAFDTARTSVPPTSMMVPLIAFLLSCLAVTIFMILPGNKAANRFGSDPHDEDHFQEASI